jgi:hypothetical protein
VPTREIAMGASNRNLNAALVRISLVAAVTCLGLTVAAVPAGAALSGTAGTDAGSVVGASQSDTVQDGVNAGYYGNFDYQTGVLSELTAMFRVPTVSCLVKGDQGLETSITMGGGF